jgi:hypothetical protein
MLAMQSTSTGVAAKSSITIRNLSDAIKQNLRVRAALL